MAEFETVPAEPMRLSNAERKRRITESWQHHLGKFPSQAKRPVIAHRLIFSMSSEQHDALVLMMLSFGETTSLPTAILQAVARV